jgi:hypothetical protein
MQADACPSGQNFNSKIKIDIKKRAFAYALDLIRLIDQLNNRDLSVQVIARQLLRSGKHFCIQHLNPKGQTKIVILHFKL